MNVENINASIFSALSEQSPQASGVSPSFSDQLLAEFSSVNNKMINAENALQDLAAGKSSNLHHVMLALEDGKLSFELLAQIRNKVLEGYQDILRMQV